MLARILGWGIDDVTRERPILQALAVVKYDNYQQFSPGMRFIESLALWLEQFKTQEERDAAYQFVRSRLIFISQEELKHLVSTSFPDFIRPILFDQTAIELDVPDRLVTKISSSMKFRARLRQSLFLGLSDGAHTDIFRRSNSESVSNEQVLPSYEFTSQRAGDLLQELNKDLHELDPTRGKDERFKNLFLLDDFSGSGRSYFRREEGDFKGKIFKVLIGLATQDSPYYSLFDPDDFSAYVILYVATDQARNHIESLVEEWRGETGFQAPVTVVAIQEIRPDIRVSQQNDEALYPLLGKYFDERIIDEHYSKGRIEHPYLGFDECALPLVLSHNTPNNSVPLIWFDVGGAPRGLFPRVSRHKEGWA